MYNLLPGAPTQSPLALGRADRGLNDWLQAPLGFAGGQWNLTAYVDNDPVNYVDPSGLVAEWNEGIGTFRERFWATIGVQESKDILGEDYRNKWRVHHRFQQQVNVAEWYYKQKNDPTAPLKKTVHDTDNLAAVPCHIHDTINNRQNAWWDNYKTLYAEKNKVLFSKVTYKDVIDSGLVTFADYEKLVKDLDDEFGKFYLSPSADLNIRTKEIAASLNISLDPKHSAKNAASSIFSTANVNDWKNKYSKPSSMLEFLNRHNLKAKIAKLGLGVLTIMSLVNTANAFDPANQEWQDVLNSYNKCFNEQARHGQTYKNSRRQLTSALNTWMTKNDFFNAYNLNAVNAAFESYVETGNFDMTGALKKRGFFSFFGD